MTPFLNNIDISTINNYFQTYCFGMHPMIDNALPAAMARLGLDIDQDEQDDFKCFEDKFNHSIDMMKNDLKQNFKVVISNPDYQAKY